MFEMNKSIRRRIKSAKLADNQSKEAVLKRLKNMVGSFSYFIYCKKQLTIYSNYELEVHSKLFSRGRFSPRGISLY